MYQVKWGHDNDVAFRDYFVYNRETFKDQIVCEKIFRGQIICEKTLKLDTSLYPCLLMDIGMLPVSILKLRSRVLRLHKKPKFI